MGTKKNYGILEIFLGIFVFSVGLTISILPSFADIYPGTLNATYAPNLQPAWVNLSKGDMFFANGNEVFIIVNFSCSPPSVCNQTMTITADFSEIGGSQNREGVFRFKDAGNTWAVFEVNDTINFSAIGGQPIMINPKNITFNATDGNVSNSYYNDTAFLTIGLVNVSYPVGCPPPDAPLPDTIPLLNGTLVNVRSCITTCTVNDRAQQYNDTHYDICGPNFGGDTTNFTELAGTGNFSNFNLTLTTFNGAGAFMGKINFLQNITLIGEQNPFSIFEFAAMSIMCGGKIGINETEWNGSATKPNLNLTARLTINTTGLGISGRPQIIRTAHSESLLTGRACPPSICSNVVWDGENISFTVSTWSDYGVSDAINVSLQSPGNFTYSSDQIINFTFLPTWEDTAIVKNCTLYGNFTGVWAANGSDTSIVKDSINARERIGYLPEVPEMYDRITGREFLYYIASLRKITRADERINTLSHMIGIDDFLDYELGSYSKGMKQKISTISAIIHSPGNLLLDEPVYGLDPFTSRTIKDFIKKRQGTTIIATHSTQLVEEVATLVYILMRGRVITCDQVSRLMDTYGTIEEAYFHYKDEFHGTHLQHPTH